jgi:hypothetical protein
MACSERIGFPGQVPRGEVGDGQRIAFLLIDFERL